MILLSEGERKAIFKTLLYTFGEEQFSKKGAMKACNFEGILCRCSPIL